MLHSILMKYKFHKFISMHKFTNISQVTSELDIFLEFHVPRYPFITLIGSLLFISYKH